MEITIDFATTRKIVAEELTQARDDIATLGLPEAYRRSQQRHDQRLAAASDASTLACKAGCSWCCHFTIDVRPIEAFRILDFVEKEFSPAEKTRVRNEIQANGTLLSSLNDVERMQQNVKCPFLSEGCCTLYEARPQTCRNYHATNVAGCRQSFEEPDNLDIDPEFAPMVFQIGGAHVDAFSKAMREAGYDIAAYELNGLLATLMDRDDLRRAFEAKGRPFDATQGMDVPMEFVDD
jgi:Fe-S-cluster containining protein